MAWLQLPFYDEKGKSPALRALVRDLSGTRRSSSVSMHVSKAPVPAPPSQCPSEHCPSQHWLCCLLLLQAYRFSTWGSEGSIKPQGAHGTRNANSRVHDGRKARELKRNVIFSSADKYHHVHMCLRSWWDQGDNWPKAAACGAQRYLMLHKGICSLAQWVHCCDTECGCCYAWGAACLAVPAWSLIRGCSAALTSRWCFQAFSCVATAPSTGNIAFCHDFLPGFDSLCLPDTGAMQGGPCRYPVDAAVVPTGALSGPWSSTCSPENPKRSFLVYSQSFPFLHTTAAPDICHVSSLVVREWKALGL